MTRSRTTDEELSQLTGIPAKEIRARIDYFDHRFKKSNEKLYRLHYLISGKSRRLNYRLAKYPKLAHALVPFLVGVGGSVAVFSLTLVPMCLATYSLPVVLLPITGAILGSTLAGYMGSRNENFMGVITSWRIKQLEKINETRSLHRPDYGPDLFLQDSFLSITNDRLLAATKEKPSRLSIFATAIIDDVKTSLSLLADRIFTSRYHKPIVKVRDFDLVVRRVQDEFHHPYSPAFRDATYKGIRWVDELLIKLAYSPDPDAPTKGEALRMKISRELRKELHDFKSDVINMAHPAHNGGWPVDEVGALEKMMIETIDDATARELLSNVGLPPTPPQPSNGGHVFALRRMHRAPKHDFVPMQ